MEEKRDHELKKKTQKGGGRYRRVGYTWNGAMVAIVVGRVVVDRPV